MATTPNIGFGSPAEYFDQVVLPAHRKFTQSPRRANAIGFAVAAWHLHDRLWHHLGKPDRVNFVVNLFSTCPELRLIRDLCDAGKHHELNRPTVTLVALEGAEGGGVGQTFGPLGMTSAFDRGSLTLEESDGSRHDAHQVFRRIAEFWRSEIERTAGPTLP